LPAYQSARKYTTTPAFNPSSATTMATATAAAAASAAGYYYYSQQRHGVAVAEAPKAAFTGGDQGFISLKLEEVETLSHNTKKFRFALPEGDMVSGLSACCMFFFPFRQHKHNTTRGGWFFSKDGQRKFKQS